MLWINMKEVYYKIEVYQYNIDLAGITVIVDRL